MSLWQKFNRIVLKRIYTNDTVLLLEKKLPTTFTSNLQIKLATANNIKDTTYFQSKTYLKQFHSFLAHGDLGYLAYLNNNCIHRSWVTVKTGKINLHKFCAIELKPNEAFIQYCETAPEARGKNVFTDVLTKIADDLTNKHLLTAVFSNNSSSLKSFTKAGFVEIERYNISIFLGVKKITKTQTT